MWPWFLLPPVMVVAIGDDARIFAAGMNVS
jgi:hypothetical protein